MNKLVNKDETFKLPRLYTEYPLFDKGVIPLSSGQAHYLNNVMRRKDGDFVRLFDGENGEWLGQLKDLTKKSGSIVLSEKLLAQPQNSRRLHLFFTPIKKSHMDWLIEKAVELGTTDFHPVLTHNTEVRKINDERVRSQIFEAAEQCERLEIPVLHELEKLETKLASWPQEIPVLSCLERYNAPLIHKAGIGNDVPVAFLIGPEGGFTAEEKDKIAEKTKAVSLGETILRVETAVVKALILLNA
ncbi:MAG TPA: RsmE family RNA methyltransferase [Alphaproteobacteria bacterium]|nr:RsmE family RNA methyltransferase [Alphaproteobacteria bacterium]